MANDSFNWFALTAIIVVIIYGGQMGWFHSTSTSTTNVAPTVMLSPALENISDIHSVGLDIEPNEICVGQQTQGKIVSNMPNAICSIYYRIVDWKAYKNVVLNAEGKYTETVTLNSTGTAMFRTVCYLEGKYAVSNDDTLVVTTCDDGNESSGNESGHGSGTQMPCGSLWTPSGQSFCSANGFCLLSQTCTYIPPTSTVTARCECV